MNENKVQQTTDTILMVSPDHFEFNAETAKSNAFQNEMNVSKEDVMREFHSMVDTLKRHNVRILVLPSRTDVRTPDAVFPNNWFSVHATDKLDEKKLVLYPMLTENRRLEIQTENLIAVLERAGMRVNQIVDLSVYADKSMFLEGTGSLILDRVNKIAYIALSPRATPDMIDVFTERLGYKACTFRSFDRNQQVIYHTNVMMSVGCGFAVVALNSITNGDERDALSKQLRATNKEIVPITLDQVHCMAGNILEVKSTDGKAKIVMSKSAYEAFTQEQRDTLSKYGELVPVNITTIETVGGGSARCMMAEIF